MSDEVENKNSSSTLYSLPSTLLSMFLRSFFIQAGWNYERSQNLGFVFSLLPALKNIYVHPEALKRAVLRHLEVFNTQPYMAGFVIGNVARMEEGLAPPFFQKGQSTGENSEALEKNMQGIKQALASSFASIGDRVFWGRLKPLTTQLCIVIWLGAGFYGWLFTGAGSEVPAAGLFAGPVSGMAVYGAFAVYLRWQGLKKGYACGGGANCGLDAMDWRKLIRRLSLAGFALSIVITLAAFALLIEFNRGLVSKSDLALKIGLVLSVLVVHRLARKFGRSIFFAIGLILAASIILFSVLKLPGFNIL
ncbi:MAG: PTS system mannose/fructose/sorbose family transporter subunit IID [Elusimicrobia bacterium]|nr:PTS system mannose/fructose/sorbose family transporter subunit IID [Elusimicrobiota bacterium]